MFRCSHRSKFSAKKHWTQAGSNFFSHLVFYLFFILFSFYWTGFFHNHRFQAVQNNTIGQAQARSNHGVISYYFMYKKVDTF